jgi:hypothetical protein
MVAAFDWMTEAPEMGYEQSFEIWDQQAGYYYFRTPDGKYGKLVVHSWRPKDLNFSYYLNPVGGRSLELKDKINGSPKNPKELYPFPEDESKLNSQGAIVKSPQNPKALDW